jgi:hypothetical protein
MKSSAALPARTDPSFDPGAVEQARKWLLSGASDVDLIEALRTAYPGADVPALVTHVLEKVRLSGELDKRLVRGFVFEGIRTIYQKAMEIGDLGTALRSLKMLKEFAG